MSCGKDYAFKGGKAGGQIGCCPGSVPNNNGTSDQLLPLNFLSEEKGPRWVVARVSSGPNIVFPECVLIKYVLYQ